MNRIVRVLHRPIRWWCWPFALSLPASVPSRELLIRLTFGIVLLSVLVQGLNLRPLVRALGIGER